MRNVGFAALALLPLLGCGVRDQSDTTSLENAESINAGVASSEELPQTAATPVVATKPVNEIRSVYTEVATARCKVVDRETEGEGSIHNCVGFGDVPLYVKEGDLRTSLDAGALSDDFATMGPFNALAGPVEWRLDSDGRPFAIIYRLRAADGEAGPRSTTLFVKSVGAQGKPGCTIAEIPGATPEANLVARRRADAVLTGASCVSS